MTCGWAIVVMFGALAILAGLGLLAVAYFGGHAISGLFDTKVTRADARCERDVRRLRRVK